MSNSDLNVDGEVLVARMNDIRNLSEQHVNVLHREAHRVVDWREHVRARPLVAVAAVTLVGYSLMSGSGSKRTSRKTRQEQKDDETVAKASAASGVMAFVGSLASAAFRSYATNYFRQQFQGVGHARHPEATTAPPRY